MERITPPLRSSLLLGLSVLWLGLNQLCGQSFQQQIDSMLQALEVATDPQHEVDLLNGIAFTYRRTAPDSTLKYATLALEMAHATAYDQGLAIGYKNRGIGLYKKGSSADSIVACYDLAIKYAERCQDYYTQAACHNNIGLIRLNNLAYNEAVQYFLNGVKIFDDHIQEEQFLKALMLGNIGTAYHKDGDNQRGIRYYEESLAMAKRIGDKVIPSIFVDELARARMEEGDLAGAERDIVALMPLHDELGDIESKTETLMTYAEVKMRQEQFAEARHYAQLAYDLADQQEFIRDGAQALLRLSQAHLGLRQLDSAQWYGERAFTQASNGGFQVLASEITQVLTDVYVQQGDYQKAYEYEHVHNQLQERNRDATNQRIADELEAKYQNQKREEEIVRLNEVKTAQQERIYGLLGVVLIILLVLAAIIYQSRQKQKATRALHAKNEALQEAEERLSEKNLELQRYIESNLQLENFAHLASHDLREPMRNIVSFSQLLQRSTEDRLDEREKEFLQFIVQGTERIEGLVKDLLTYSQVSNTPLEKTRIHVKDLLADVQQDLQQMIEESSARIEMHHVPEFLYADRSRMYQLFQNLLSNAIRYRCPNTAPAITISAEEQGEHLLFKVADNGIGIDPAYHQLIFMLFKSLQNKSVHNSSGIGLATAKRVVEDHRGQIWVEDNTPHGSVFCFTIANSQAA